MYNTSPAAGRRRCAGPPSAQPPAARASGRRNLSSPRRGCGPTLQSDVPAASGRSRQARGRACPAKHPAHFHALLACARRSRQPRRSQDKRAPTSSPSRRAGAARLVELSAPARRHAADEDDAVAGLAGRAVAHRRGVNDRVAAARPAAGHAAELAPAAGRRAGRRRAAGGRGRGPGGGSSACPGAPPAAPGLRYSRTACTPNTTLALPQGAGKAPHL